MEIYQPELTGKREHFLPLPDFMTKASLELMLSAVFLAFFVGAIVALKKFCRG